MGIPMDLNSVKRQGQERKCPECGSKDIGYEKEEYYCEKCGFVLD